MGFSLDASPDLINQAYIVSAHVQEVSPRGRWGVAEEKFTAICLPGMLPGFFMSYNHHGFAYCVNTISTGIEVTDKQTRKVSVLPLVFILEPFYVSARHFLCRALLSVNNIFDVTEILQDEGHGISNGLSINMIFCRYVQRHLLSSFQVCFFVSGKKVFLYFIMLKLRPLLTKLGKKLNLNSAF